MKKCDLHCHSVFSDGRRTPEELIDLACAADLGAIALTDHNTMEGTERFLKSAEGRIQAVAGCEISTEAYGQELHLVGLFWNPEKVELVQQKLREQILRKEESNRRTIERLAEAGYDLSYEEFLALSGEGSLNRVHIARYLMSKGIIKDVEEGFANLLSKKGGYYQEAEKLDFFEMLSVITEAGGVSVWAHPLHRLDRDTCLRILGKAKACGLDGAEAYYSTYTPEDTAFMLEQCKKYSLLISGGSDFHGENKPGLYLGVGYGDLVVPYECYEKLEERAREKAKNC
ncbi:MAG: PHP domain-containing protein [Clostridiales bacterium]|nr:PHP domain-containing protein [Candidatus Blautia equi]